MLHESYVSQKEENVFRRWFQDDYFDLIVWYDLDTKTITGFQLCYDKNRNEHAFTWHRDSGFSHNRIDNSRSPQSYAGTPILVDDGIFPYNMVMSKFVESSGGIDAAIRDLVMEKLNEYSRS
ncbi:MAG TPA: hypothetical protein PLM53_17110 [Spirochaetota bacterium]|nr:hypothetical protein [Spirochaetota bacterium]HPC42980.1 hypothetical protein [Spirochaetota bacterium]HPL18577.1 hypothetical protein [Spirochaetota bacterium]HQF10079.1 hypothetical protein [Spirochaetota bacterium]HQH98819.1 hypothetical protein [Spirochaetota bacterium]